MLMFYLSMIETDEERDFFTELYEKYRQGIFRYANKYLHNDYDAEDVLHDVFCMVANKCVKDLMERSEVGRRRFLFMCAKYRAINYGKRRSKVVSIDAMLENNADFPADLTDDPIADIITDEDMLERGKIAINSLDKPYADVLWMSLEGYSVQDIAEFFGEKAGTIKKRLYRAKQMLRAAVGGEGGELL